MKRVKLQLWGKELPLLEDKRCPLNVSVHGLTINQKTAIIHLVNKWLCNDEDSWLMTPDEAIDLKNNLHNNTHYEKF